MLMASTESGLFDLLRQLTRYNHKECVKMFMVLIKWPHVVAVCDGVDQCCPLEATITSTAVPSIKLLMTKKNATHSWKFIGFSDHLFS